MYLPETEAPRHYNNHESHVRREDDDATITNTLYLQTLCRPFDSYSRVHIRFNATETLTLLRINRYRRLGPEPHIHIRSSRTEIPVSRSIE